MGAHENLEHAEHAAHSGGHGAKHMGLTMAILGVLIAFAAAMVGSQRQELMTTLLDQSWAHSSSVAAAIKSKITAVELEKLRNGAAATGNPELPRLLHLDVEYNNEYTLAEKWDDSCEPLIDAHYDAAEGYDHAQLLAEVGIIIASLGILLVSRTAWIISLVAGVLCLGQVGYTFVTSHRAISEHHEKVHAAQHAYEHNMEQRVDAKEHEEALNELDPGGKIRATFVEESKAEAHSPAAASPTPEQKKTEE